MTKLYDNRTYSQILCAILASISTLNENLSEHKPVFYELAFDYSAAHKKLIKGLNILFYRFAMGFLAHLFSSTRS